MSFVPESWQLTEPLRQFAKDHGYILTVNRCIVEAQQLSTGNQYVWQDIQADV